MLLRTVCVCVCSAHRDRRKKIEIKCKAGETEKNVFPRIFFFLSNHRFSKAELLSELSLEHFDTCCRTNCGTWARTRSPRLASRTRALDTPTGSWRLGARVREIKREREREREGGGRKRESGREGLKFHNPAVSDTPGLGS